MNKDTLNKVINDVKMLSLECRSLDSPDGNAEMLRMALSRISERLQALCDAGLYITPKAAVEALNAEKRNRPLRVGATHGEATEPSGARAETDAERLKRYLTVRYTGIEFKRYFSPHFVRLVGSFVNPTGDKNQNHVYELHVKESASRPVRWIAKGTNDGRELFTLTCASKWGAERLGFGALRSYLLRHLRKTIKANKAKEGK